MRYKMTMNVAFKKLAGTLILFTSVLDAIVVMVGTFPNLVGFLPDKELLLNFELYLFTNFIKLFKNSQKKLFDNVRTVIKELIQEVSEI